MFNLRITVSSESQSCISLLIAISITKQANSVCWQEELHCWVWTRSSLAIQRSPCIRRSLSPACARKLVFFCIVDVPFKTSPTGLTEVEQTSVFLFKHIASSQDSSFGKCIYMFHKHTDLTVKLIWLCYSRLMVRECHLSKQLSSLYALHFVKNNSSIPEPLEG